MRSNLNYIIGPHQREYLGSDHSALFDNLKKVGRDHYHVRYGKKENAHYFAIVLCDLKERSMEGHLVGPDDDQMRRVNLIDIKFSIPPFFIQGSPITIHLGSTDGVHLTSSRIRLFKLKILSSGYSFWDRMIFILLSTSSFVFGSLNIYFSALIPSK